MFTIYDYRTAEGFKKRGYKVFHPSIGNWLAFFPDEKLPKDIGEEWKNLDISDSKPKRKYTKSLEVKIKKVLKARRKKLKKRGRPKGVKNN